MGIRWQTAIIHRLKKTVTWSERTLPIRLILKRLDSIKPVCKKCGANAFNKELNPHHKDGDSS